MLGFHAKGDGSHHKRIAKSEDDGSGEQGQNGIWWCIVHSGEVNVSWFGANIVACFNYGVDIVIDKDIQTTETLILTKNVNVRNKSNYTITKTTNAKKQLSKQVSFYSYNEDASIDNSLSYLTINEVDAVFCIDVVGSYGGTINGLVLDSSSNSDYGFISTSQITTSEITNNKVYNCKQGFQFMVLFNATIKNNRAHMVYNGFAIGALSTSLTYESNYASRVAYCAHLLRQVWYSTIKNNASDKIGFVSDFAGIENAYKGAYFLSNCRCIDFSNNGVEGVNGFSIRGFGNRSISIDSNISLIHENILTNYTNSRNVGVIMLKDSFDCSVKNNRFEFNEKIQNAKLFNALFDGYRVNFNTSNNIYLNTDGTTDSIGFSQMFGTNRYFETFKNFDDNGNLNITRKAGQGVSNLVFNAEDSSNPGGIQIVKDGIVQYSLIASNGELFERGINNVIIRRVNLTNPTMYTLDTPYYTTKMQQQGIYNDYVNYRDELHDYENSQVADDTMLLPVLQEPVIPESVKAFAEKYRLI
ncbi:MAG: hypothetical protein ACRCZO_18890 [Cetobacterium sp.]